MNQIELLSIVHQQLALDLNCTVADLVSEETFIFVEAAENEGRRAFPRREQYFEMLTVGKAVVISATPARLDFAKKQFAGKSREEAYALPFVLDYSLNYVPDLANQKRLLPPEKMTYELLEQERIHEFVHLKDFTHALHVEAHAEIQIQLAMVAKEQEQVVAVASAYNWCANMWGIGVDVLPAYRQRGLAAYLVNALSHELLARQIIPCYETSATNLNSQRVATKAGFFPAWLCDRRVSFEGSLQNHT